jgi:hypothetical protein
VGEDGKVVLMRVSHMLPFTFVLLCLSLVLMAMESLSSEILCRWVEAYLNLLLQSVTNSPMLQHWVRVEGKDYEGSGHTKMYQPTRVTLTTTSACAVMIRFQLRHYCWEQTLFLDIESKTVGFLLFVIHDLGIEGDHSVFPANFWFIVRYMLILGLILLKSGIR